MMAGQNDMGPKTPRVLCFCEPVSYDTRGHKKEIGEGRIPNIESRSSMLPSTGELHGASSTGDTDDTFAALLQERLMEL